MDSNSSTVLNRVGSTKRNGPNVIAPFPEVVIIKFSLTNLYITIQTKTFPAELQLTSGFTDAASGTAGTAEHDTTTGTGAGAVTVTSKVYKTNSEEA